METKLIFKKMSDVMRDIAPVAKEQTNSMQGFKFRGIDQMINALYPALTRHGVFMTTDLVSQENTLREVTRSNGKTGLDNHASLVMRYTFHAEDGSSVSSTLPGYSVDQSDKSVNKALSAALKYALIQTFCIPTADMVDGDLTSPELASGVDYKKSVKSNVVIASHIGNVSSATSVPLEEVVVQTTKPTFRKSNAKTITEEIKPTSFNDSGKESEKWT